MSQVTPAFDEWTLPCSHIGRRVLLYDRTDSTNDRAVELANDPANDGVVILANEQTAGRGQQGRTWHCAAGDGVLMSILLFPPPALRRPALLTAWAAVSVCETILQAANIQAKIKWPNDVLIRGRKVCGILTEQSVVSGQSSVVCGIGLNVNQSADAFELPGLEHGTSLAVAAGQRFDCQEIARELIRRLDEEYERLCAGDLATLEACWKWRLGLLGKQVEAECLDGVCQGRLIEVGWAGLEIETGPNQIRRVLPEAVRQLRSQS
jgi:BirA family biotin operon repressor/biotin-[acetyl-CoA-carboxylase] ligase